MAAILVTRAEPGARETARRLRALGHRAVLCPALALQRTAAPLQLPEGADLVFSSANGVRFFSEAAPTGAAAGRIAWCVGPATRDAAAAAGFARTPCAHGDADALAALVAADADTERPLVHVANSAAAGRIVETLSAQGFAIRFAPLYEARTSPALPEEARVLLEARAADLVLIHSAKGAGAFAALSAGLPRGYAIAAISRNAAAPLDLPGAGRICVAEQPNEAALMDAVQRCLATGTAPGPRPRGFTENGGA